MGWARLLERVFGIDIEHCPQCGGDLKIIAAIEEPAVIVKILTHLGLPARAARRLEFFVVAWRGRVLHRRAIVSDRFGSDVGCLVRINSRSLVGQGDLQSEFAAIKTPVVFTNRRRSIF